MGRVEEKIIKISCIITLWKILIYVHLYKWIFFHNSRNPHWGNNIVIYLPIVSDTHVIYWWTLYWQKFSLRAKVSFSRTILRLFFISQHFSYFILRHFTLGLKFSPFSYSPKGETFRRGISAVRKKVPRLEERGN